jgi:hypothetical protein
MGQFTRGIGEGATMMAASGVRVSTPTARLGRRTTNREGGIMKKLVALAVFALVAFPMAASAQESYLETLRQDVRAEKTALLTDHLKLSDADAKVFWPIQRQYELELAKIQDARVAMIKEFLSTEKLTAEQAKKIGDQALKLEGDRTALKKKYFAQISKKLSPVIAARYLQLETFIQTWIDTQIQGALPAAQ